MRPLADPCPGPEGPLGGALVVDDSPFVRQALRRILEDDPLVGWVEVAGTGQIALDRALRRGPRWITLDLQMPVMDGFTFLRLFRARSTTPVLVVSSHADLKNVEKALELGASGFISKPRDPYRDLAAIAEELYLKLRHHAGLPVDPAATGPGTAPAPGEQSPGYPVVVIGSSSGGPPTLQYLLSSLPPAPPCAFLIAQHMPAGFTDGFARRLDALLPLPVREARDGEPVRPGEVLVAPGGGHLTVRGPADAAWVEVEPAGADPCAPSVDRLLHSAAQTFGPRVKAVILTGMGADGAEGVRAVKAAGGKVLAESAETAAIFGMPKRAAATGCVDGLLPLPELAVRLMRLCNGQGAASQA